MQLTKLKELLTEDDAVSPVIGVILMVAITVILAAVIASFVLGLGDQAQQATPQASFSWEFDDPDTVTITHDGGDTIQASELYVRGTVNSGGASINKDWSTLGVSSSEVTAGNQVQVSSQGGGTLDSEYDLRVIYETAEGDNSATLSQDTGPDA